MPYTLTLGTGDSAVALATADDTVEELSLDGQSLVQLVQGLRAPIARPLNRGNRTRTLTIRVKRRQAASPILAALAMLEHEHALSVFRGPTLVLGIGAAGGGFTCTFTDAVIAHRARAPGTASHHDYTIQAGSLSLDAESLPTTTGPIMLKKGTVSLASGATSAAITFATAFASAPIVSVELIAPTGQPIVGRVLSPAPTASGFTVLFAAALPASGYALTWTALL
jgi:hypothetical protein